MLGEERRKNIGPAFHGKMIRKAELVGGMLGQAHLWVLNIGWYSILELCGRKTPWKAISPWEFIMARMPPFAPSLGKAV